MGMLREGIPILAGLVALVAGWTDWRSRRIPNWLTVPGAILGLAANTLAQGWPGMKSSLEGVGLGLLLLLPLVVARALGAGDWKLVGAIGAILGPHDLLLVLAAAVLIAGVMAMALVIYKKRLGQTLRNIGSLLLALLTGHPGERSISLDNPESLKVPFGVAVAVAVIVFVGQRLTVGSIGF
jgi:prepilin peptidase CpaA